MTAATPLTPGQQPAGGRQVLSFLVGEQEFAVDILKVQEIRGKSSITGMPRTAAWVRGAMNLRGNIVPVIDVRARLGVTDGAATRPVIVVVSVGPRLVGLQVDAVCDVIELPAEAIEPPPEIKRDDDVIEALARHGERLLVLVNLEELIG
ncbi:MAG: chemotaxis protein CheW [Myxococcota bacterium]